MTKATEIERLQARVRETELALQFYACSDNWWDRNKGFDGISRIEEDFGRRAKKALPPPKTVASERRARALLNSPALPKESITDGWVRR